MAEHVHEWGVWHEGMEWGTGCKECFEGMDDNELERRLNATERLSAEVARDCGEAGGIYKKENRDALQAYADILEGKL